MKRHFWKILTRLILILSLGFVSLLHAVEYHAVNKESTRYKAGKLPYPLSYTAFGDFLDKHKSGFDTVISKSANGKPQDKTIQIKGSDVTVLAQSLEKIKKYRTGIDACVEKATEETDKDGTSDKFAKFLDDFQDWLSGISGKDSDDKKDGHQVKISDKKFFAYIAAVHEYLEAKGNKFTNKKLSETSSGDVKLLAALSTIAKTMTGSDPVIKDGKIGEFKIEELKNDEKGIFKSIESANKALTPSTDACLVSWDAPVANQSGRPGAGTTPNGNPLPGQPGGSQETLPIVTPTVPTLPVTPPTPLANGDAGLQDRLSAQRQAEDAVRDALRRFQEEEDDGADRRDLRDLAQLARTLQPQGSRSSDNDRSATGPTFSPSTQLPNGSSSPLPINPPPDYGTPQPDNTAALMQMLMANQNRGSSDNTVDLVRAMLASSRTNEVPYTPPVPVVPRQDPMADPLRMWMMNMMMNGQQQQGRPNIYNRPGYYAQTGSRPLNGGFASTAGAPGLRIPGARANFTLPRR